MFVVGDKGLDLSGAEALAILRFAWPTFVQVDDCILLADHFSEDNYQSWRADLRDNWGAIEEVINHVHLWDCVPDAQDEEILIAIGGILQESWQAAAAQQFPSREFLVELTNDESDYGPTLYLSTRHETTGDENA